MREKIIQIAVVLLLLLPSISARAASFYMDGICYDNSADLVEAWNARYPVVTTAGTLTYVSYASKVSATGLLTSRVSSLNLSTGAVTAGVVFTNQLRDCTATMGFVSTGKIDRTIIIIAMVFAVLFGFNVGRNFFPDKFGGAA